MKEISSILATAEVRAIPDNVEKAVYSLFNSLLDEEISFRSLCSSLNISRHTLKNRLKSIFSGYTKHFLHKPTYLAPIYDEQLAELVWKSEDSLASIPKDEIIEAVWKLIKPYVFIIANK